MTKEDSYMQGFKKRCSHHGIDPRSLIVKMSAIMTMPGVPVMPTPPMKDANMVAAMGPQQQQQMKANTPKVEPLPKVASTPTLPPLSRPRIVRKPESQTPADAPTRKPVQLSAGPYGT